MRLYLVAVIVWTGTALVTSESDSHENWSNEKVLPAYSYIYEIKEGGKSSQTEGKSNTDKTEDGTYTTSQDNYSVSLKDRNERTLDSPLSNGSAEEKSNDSIDTEIVVNGNDYEMNETDPRQHVPLQILQPYLVDAETKTPTREENEEIDHKSTAEIPEELSRQSRMSQEVSNDTLAIEFSPSEEILFEEQSDTSIPRYLPAPENNTNDLGYVPEDVEYGDLENVGGFGQRVRASPSFREKNNENSSSRSKIQNDARSIVQEETREHKKRQRGQGVRTRGGQFSSKRPYLSEKILNGGTTTKHLSHDNNHRVPTLKHVESPRISQKETEVGERIINHETQEATNKEHNKSAKKERRTEHDFSSSIKDASLSATTPALTLSSGKLSGPIVVPELPQRFKKFPYLTTDYPHENDVSSSPRPIVNPTESAVSLETLVKSKSSDSNYLTTSSVVLNPLQVGVALVNAGRDESEKLRIDGNETGATRENLEKLEHQEDDQVVQQEQLSEVVAQKSPVQSVEVQKSVEIFHTAPIQEIHYPLEFVPYGQLSGGKNRHVEMVDNSQKLNQGFVKDRGPPQASFSVYKSNEIFEENLVPSRQISQERYRDEYISNNNNNNANVYTPNAIKPDQSLPITDRKPVFGTRENLDDVYHEQSHVINVQHANANPSEEELVKDLEKQYTFEFSKSTDHSRQEQPTRVNQIAKSPLVINYETAQNQEAPPQFVFRKHVDREQNPQADVKAILMPIPQPYPVEKLIEKTVHLSHPTEVEKIIENKAPYSVEKVIEKQVTIPQPFPIHVPIDRVVEKQIRIPQLYPIHIDRVIEKKVPYTIQRFIIQSYPVHVKVPQPYSIEKPVHLPVPLEKVVEKTVHVPRPYPVEILKIVKSVPVHPYYNVQYDVNYQQGIRPQNFHHNAANNLAYGTDEKIYSNSSQFYGHHHANGYVPQSRTVLTRQPQIISKKFGTYGSHSYSILPSYATLNGNIASYGRHAGDTEKIKDEYVGPVPRKVLSNHGMQSKSSQFVSSQEIQSMITSTPLRRVRQEGSLPGSTGSFRQSKMEYGFKPPMVPSVQYDEKTATKVE